ncbi:MAG: ATP-binding protein [Propionibacteriaceae bacterium]|nr:ATP-binding protein [Propionibacteriaceae bacterium]
MLPPNVSLWTIALVLPLVLLIAWVFATIARLLLRGRARLGAATAIVLAILATSLGLLVTGWLRPDAGVFSPLTILICLGFSVAAIAAYGAVAAYVQRPVRASVPELLVQGESDRLEFKSTARVNLRTGSKDERMEQVIAKAVCGFLNADGGTLLIGVDDTGTVLGLETDFATLKSPDADRFELWLRDLLSTTMGANAANLVAIDFTTVPGDAGEAQVCRLDCGASPRPVYLRPGKGAAPELYVRSGNSTRQLRVDDATDYVMHRWPLSLGSNLAAQVKAAVRFSGESPAGRQLR